MKSGDTVMRRKLLNCNHFLNCIGAVLSPSAIACNLKICAPTLNGAEVPASVHELFV